MEERGTKRPHQQQVTYHYKWLRPKYTPGPRNAWKRVGETVVLAATRAQLAGCPQAVAGEHRGALPIRAHTRTLPILKGLDS